MNLRNIVWLTVVCLLFIQVSTGNADTFTKKVAQDSDDAVELSAGNIYKYNLDLYFGSYGYDYTKRYINATGIRFQNITIPPGAHITSARIKMTKKTANSSLDVSISGQLDADPATFAYNQNDITGRTKTTATVPWKPDKWKSGNYKITTPDLAPLVQEIVDQSGWASGNSMAFIFEGTGSAAVKGYGDGNKIPKLIIDYTLAAAPEITLNPADQVGVSTYQGVTAPNTSFELKNTGNAPLNFAITGDVSWLNFSITSGTVAAGGSITIPVSYPGSNALAASTYTGTITVSDTDGNLTDVTLVASLTVKPVVIGSMCGDVPLYAQNLVNPAMLIELDISGSMGSTMYVLDDVNNPKTPDLKSIVQEIVNQSGWVSGNNMAFIIEDNGGHREAMTYNKAWYTAPLLHIEYNNSGTTEVFEARVTASQDDAEEYGGGGMTLTSTDLDLGYYLSGIRIQDVTIPQGATISSAYLQFVPSGTRSAATNATIYGELNPDAPSFTSTAHNISSRSKTTSSASWNNIPAWTIATKETRLKIAKDTLKNLVEDRTISWGFASWTSKYSSSYDYTKIHNGIKQRTVAETLVLQNSIDSLSEGGSTPLQPSMVAGRKYFTGNKADLDGDSQPYFDSSRSCQPKFLIEITDGLGNTATTTAGVITESGNLADNDINTIAIGFGIDNATQIKEIAKISNARGKADPDDDLYALHDEDANGVGQPFLAMSGNELADALDQVKSGVKKQLFYGSSPAPSTSVDHGNFVINAEFNASDWSGDLIATPYDPATGALTTCKDTNGNATCDPAQIVDNCICWTASQVMPSTKSAWTVNSSGSVIQYLDATLPTDNYICKDLGDIIRSTPVIVESPRKYYDFDNYRYFKYADAANRKGMVYVGSNDGALHALDLKTGVEQWRFYPKAVQNTLNMAQLDPSYDMCDAFHYCHRYMVDGSPVVTDVFLGTGSVIKDTNGDITNSGWRTLLINGLGNGGSAYFAIDITATDDFSGTEPAVYLWQFEDPELGFATSTPAIDRITYNTSVTSFGGWAAYFGSGYDTGTNQANKEAYVYGIEAYSGNDLWKDEAGLSINRIKMDVGNDLTLSYDGQVVEFNTGDTITGLASKATATIANVLDSGNTGQLKLNNVRGTFQDNELIQGPSLQKAVANGTLDTTTTPSTLKFDGEINSFMVGETITGKTSGASATVSGIVDNGTDGTLSLTNVAGGPFLDNEKLVGNIYAEVNGSISGSFKDNAMSDPLIVDIDYDNYGETLYLGDLYCKMYRINNIGKDETPTVSLFFDMGTNNQDTPIRAGGSYAYSTVDDMVWIYFGTGKYEEQIDKYTTNQQYFFGIQDTLNDTATTMGLSGLVGLTAKNVTSAVSGTSADYRIIQGSNTGKDSWYVKLVTDTYPSERVIAKPLVAGGLVFFSTFRPDNDPCGGNGQAWLYALDYDTGLPPDYSVFDVSGDSKFDDNDKVTDGTKKYFVAAIPIGRGIPTAPVLEDDVLFVNTTDNPGSGIKINLPKMKATLRYWHDNAFE